MNVKIKNEAKIRGTSARAATRADGVQILISYATPVAAFIPGRGYFRSSRRYSVTTSRQVNEWTSRTDATMEPAELAALYQGEEGTS